MTENGNNNSKLPVESNDINTVEIKGCIPDIAVGLDVDLVGLEVDLLELGVRLEIRPARPFRQPARLKNK
jgi:hypothetical protein